MATVVTKNFTHGSKAGTSNPVYAFYDVTDSDGQQHTNVKIDWSIHDTGTNGEINTALENEFN